MKNRFITNRENLINKMEERSVLLLDSGKAPHKTTDQFYHYTPNRNFYYLTGLNEENCKLMIVKGKEQSITFLFIEETTDFMRKWVGEKISKEEASDITGIDISKIHYHDQFKTFFRALMTPSRGLTVEIPSLLYLDLYRVNASSNPISLSQFSFVLKAYKELQVKNINEHLTFLRMVKSDEEIDNLKVAIEHTKHGLNRIMQSVKERENEYQVQADYVHEITLRGSEGISFNSIIASGKNATILHYEENNSPLQKTDLLLCDLGSLYQNYGSDITRTYPISGRFTKRQKDIYQVVLECNKECIKLVKPGATWKELNIFAKTYLTKGLKSLGLLTEDTDLGKYYFHSIGHHLGLDVHDTAQNNIPFSEGMVLTIEPGLYIKEENIGVRIEDDILVTKDGNINLSKNIIKEIKDIEEYMN